MTAAGRALLGLGLALGGGRAHPMHTAVAELVQEDARGATSVRLRVFADDFQAAVAPGTDGAAADSGMARYLRGTFAIADRTGRPVRLAWDGAERAGDVILVRLRGAVPGGLAGARVTSLVLCEAVRGRSQRGPGGVRRTHRDDALHPWRGVEGAALSAPSCGRSAMACRLTGDSAGAPRLRERLRAMVHA